MADILNKWKTSLERTRKVAFGRLANFFGATEISIDTWDELESMLIQADIGIDTTAEMIAALITIWHWNYSPSLSCQKNPIFPVRNRLLSWL